ncbi:MAG: serine protease [Bryobacteraceae bacterium]
MDQESRIVITPDELALRGQSQTAPPPQPKRIIPWWSLLIVWTLALSFPLLAVFAIGVRLAIRRQQAARREAWKGLLCTALIVSGLTNMAALVWFTNLVPNKFRPASNSASTLHLTTSIQYPFRLPNLPSETAMTPVELAARTKDLVFIVSPDLNVDPRHDTFGISQIGAGALLLATGDGLLIGTNRHVVDPGGPFHLGVKENRALVVSAGGQYAEGRIVGRHQNLDLALLWVPRTAGGAAFRQPITAYSAIPVGDPVFVVGHPQRLFFTLSNGLISRLDEGVLQLSAPVSPGNSGGPAYDSLGNLLGIVTAKLDRSITPNAENLNFATRADAFLIESGWDFLDNGKILLQQLRDPGE